MVVAGDGKLVQLIDNEADYFNQMVEVLNRRGHGSMFARDNKVISREMVEIGVAYEWANSMQKEFGTSVTEICSSGADHPDCYATCGEKRINLELTELVHEHILERCAKTPRSEMTLDESRKLFDDSQWTSQLLFDQLSVRLDKKKGKYSNAGVKLDALIIHTDESWLSPQNIERWLNDFDFPVRNNVASAYLLCTYTPGYREWWPIFRLYGKL